MAVRLEPRWTSNVQDLTAAGGDGLTLCWILAFEGFKTWPVTSTMQKLHECSGSRRFRAANDAREARELAQQMGEDNSGANRGGKYNDQKGLEVFFWNDLNKSQDSGIPPSCLCVIYGYSISRSTGDVWSSLWLQLYYSRRVGSESNTSWLDRLVESENDLFGEWSFEDPKSKRIESLDLAFKTLLLGNRATCVTWATILTSGTLCPDRGTAFMAKLTEHLHFYICKKIQDSSWLWVVGITFQRKKQEWNKHETTHHKRSVFF